MSALITEAFVEKTANHMGIEPRLLSSLVAIETAWNPYRIRFEPNWRYDLITPELFAKKLWISVNTEIQCQKISWGPVQIMGVVAREHGFDDHLTSLIHPEIGLQIGCLEVLQVLKKYGITTDGISAYNWGSPNRGDDGQYLNQGYVNRFLSEWENRGGRVEGIKLVF